MPKAVRAKVRKTPKVTTKSKSRKVLGRFFQNRVLAVAVFLVAFGAIGGAIYLRQSSALAYGTCDGGWRQIPGNGRSWWNPDIVQTGHNTGRVLVRGTDNRIYATGMDIYNNNIRWVGAWYRYNNDLNGQTVDIPTQHNYGSGTSVRVTGTDWRTYESSISNASVYTGTPWQPVGGGTHGVDLIAYIRNHNTNRLFNVQVGVDQNYIVYRCWPAW